MTQKKGAQTASMEALWGRIIAFDVLLRNVMELHLGRYENPAAALDRWRSDALASFGRLHSSDKFTEEALVEAQESVEYLFDQLAIRLQNRAREAGLDSVTRQ